MRPLVLSAIALLVTSGIAQAQTSEPLDLTGEKVRLSASSDAAPVVGFVELHDGDALHLRRPDSTVDTLALSSLALVERSDRGSASAVRGLKTGVVIGGFAGLATGITGAVTVGQTLGTSSGDAVFIIGGLTAAGALGGALLGMSLGMAFGSERWSPVHVTGDADGSAVRLLVSPGTDGALGLGLSIPVG